MGGLSSGQVGLMQRPLAEPFTSSHNRAVEAGMMEASTNSRLRGVHHRQFIIDRRAYRIESDWKALDLANGYILSYCPHARIRVSPRSDNSRDILIGNAFQAHPEGAPVAHFLAAGGDVAEETYGWAGRWVMISDGVILGDFSNSLGLFYRHEGGEFIVSSSLALLHRLYPHQRLVRRRFNRRGLNWTPPPTTKMAGTRKLLPDQVIDLRSRTVRYAPKSRFVPDRLLDAETIGGLLLDALQRVWRQLACEFRRVRLSLTGGYDSRTLMAAGLSTGVRFDAVTLEHGRISLADRRLPAELCADRSVPYRYVRLGKRRPDLERLYNEHTLGDTDEADRDYWRRNMFSWLEEGDCLVRGTAFSLARRHYHPIFRGLRWETVTRDPALVVRPFGDFASMRLEASQISQWIEWRSHHPEPYDWIEAFYRDQRLCGWSAACEQGLDLLCGTSINPANCGYILDLLQRATPSAKSESAHQLECIRQSRTGLDRFPCNPVFEGRLSRWALRLRQMISRATIEGANFLGI